MKAWLRNVLHRSSAQLFRAAPPRLHSALSRLVTDTMSEEDRRRFGLQTMQGALGQLAQNGLDPATIFDVGAYVGEWTAGAARSFPSARLVMVEPVAERHARLHEVVAALGGRAVLHAALVGREPRESVEFNVMGTGSSLFEENTSFPRTRVRLPMVTLDALAAESGPGPYLLKLDVQGAELEVLLGASATLGRTEAVVMEVSLLEYNRGAPLFAEVVAFMRARRFVLYDVCGGLRRASDGALFQLDCVFVPEASRLRAARKFWSHET